jgi:hypothetical protein
MNKYNKNNIMKTFKIQYVQKMKETFQNLINNKIIILQ